MEVLVLEVLRTKELQRLRRIHQLGLAHFVFPGAEHSRLVHSLGAAFLAIRFTKQLQSSCRSYLVERLTPSESAVRDVAVAALCHDLGHGPLSHVWEREVVGEPYDVERWCDSLNLSDRHDVRGLKWHELVTQALLGWKEGQLHRLLEAYEAGFAKRIQYFLRGKYYLAYLPRLISGDIDIDRADYVRRDTHQTGVAYGRYDLDWLVSTFTVGATAENKLVVGFDGKKSPRVVEQFLIARRALYDTVYYHKTVRASEGMVGLLLKRVKEVVRELPHLVEQGFAQPLMRMIRGEAVGLSELLAVDDFSLWVLIDYLATEKIEDLTVRDLAQRIVTRDLFKLVPVSPERANEFLRRPDAYDRIHDVIQPYCPGKREYYLIVDSLKFATLSEKPEQWCYFVDENRHATPTKEHEQFREYWKQPHEAVRLFTLREAVDAVGNLMS